MITSVLNGGAAKQYKDNSEKKLWSGETDEIL